MCWLERLCNSSVNPEWPLWCQSSHQCCRKWMAGIFMLCKTTEWDTSRPWTTWNSFTSSGFIAVTASKAFISEWYRSFFPLLASNPLTSWTCTFALICCSWPKGSDGLTGSKPRPDKTAPLFFQPSEAYRSSRTYIFSLAVRLCCTRIRNGGCWHVREKEMIILTDLFLQMSLILDDFNQVRNINTRNVYSGL